MNSERDALIELIDDFIYNIDVTKWYSEEHDEGLADHLLANGVVKVVRCKDCKYSRPRNESEMRIYFEGVLICESCQMADEPCAVCDDDFCSYGELKECEGK